jgi:predicted aminopeptidase
MRRVAFTTALCALALLAQGCFGVRYASQAAGGQLGILRAARPLTDVIRDPETDPDVQRMLVRVPEVKRFGSIHGLSATKNYARYADLRRPAAVWVVQACAPLSFDVHYWRIPLIGTLPYLGWFDRKAAERHAADLARRGLDVEVRPASAYSTLGWFSDPLLSTMIRAGDGAVGDLANVVLHESVHATLYVPDQSAFNESLASFVADELTRWWLVDAFGSAARETRAWVQLQARRRARTERLRATWTALDALYRSDAPDDAKRAEKARILGETERELGLQRPLNNAALAGYRAYAGGGAAFERLLRACGGSFPRFLTALETLRPDDFGRRQVEAFDPIVDELAARGCITPPSSSTTRRR